MEALSRFGDLAWFKLPTEYNQVHGYHQVLYMGWRYASPREGIGELISGAIRRVPTQLDWTLDRSRRNWLLLPIRIIKEAPGLSDPAFSNTIHSINLNDRDFCLATHEDVDLIIQRLQEMPAPTD